jgi:acyl-CoA reductase-like NAD-dependent aldehyde dehydrogenase
MSELFKRVSMGGKVAEGDLEVKAPFDGEVIAMVKTASGDEVEATLAAVHAAFRNREHWIPKSKRMAILRKTAEFIIDQANELAFEIAQEAGKPLVDARTEVRRAAGSLRLAADTLGARAGREVPMDVDADSAGRTAYTRYDPIGVVVAVGAAADPLNGVVHQVAPAAAAGCPVILKPSSKTPLCGTRFIEMLQRDGFGEDWCRVVVTPDHVLTERLVSDRRVGFVTFAGHTEVGWKLRSLLAPGTRCALAHGGASPVIVAADAPLNRVVPALAEGGFLLAGQTPASVQRVFVERSIARDLADKLAKTAGRLVVGDPTSDQTHVGPLLTRSAVERADAWVKEAVAAGAEALCGAAKHSESCYVPTVLWDPPADARLSREEAFAPVVCVYPYDDLDEAIERSNEVTGVLQAAVFTCDLPTAMRACERLDAPSVLVNDHTAFRVDWMPFSGRGTSGLGIGGIPQAIQAMQLEKMVVLRDLDR